MNFVRYLFAVLRQAARPSLNITQNIEFIVILAARLSVYVFLPTKAYLDHWNIIGHHETLQLNEYDLKDWKEGESSPAL